MLSLLMTWYYGTQAAPQSLAGEGYKRTFKDLKISAATGSSKLTRKKLCIVFLLKVTKATKCLLCASIEKYSIWQILYFFQEYHDEEIRSESDESEDNDAIIVAKDDNNALQLPKPASGILIDTSDS